MGWQKWEISPGQGTPIGSTSLYSTPLLLEVPLEEKFTFSTSVDTKCAHEAYEVSILGAAPSLVGVRLSNSAQGSP